MLSFLEYLVFFGAGFCSEKLKIICRMDFDMFFGILILSQSEDFAWAIGFACMMADFQNAPFLEYLVFFGGVSFTERLKMICRMDFDVFWNFNF